MNHPQLHDFKHLVLRILRCPFTVGGSDDIRMYSKSRPVSNMSQTYRSPVLEREEDIETRGPILNRLLVRIMTEI